MQYDKKHGGLAPGCVRNRWRFRAGRRQPQPHQVASVAVGRAWRRGNHNKTWKKIPSCFFMGQNRVENLRPLHLRTAASLSPCRKSLPPVKASVSRQPNDHMSAGVDGLGGALKAEVGWKPDRRLTFLQSWVSPPPPPSSFSSPSPLLPRLLLSSLLLCSVSPSQESLDEHCDLSELS